MQFQLPPGFYTSDTIASLALILTLMAVRVIAGRALRRRDNLTETVARRWSANVRNVLVLVAVIGLIMIWAPQLRTFALSLTAVAVAIVVATKELILCFSGAAFRTFTRAFSVGDIVEIGSSKGEVVDLNLLALRLREFDERDGSIAPTGRTLILPYSLLFSSPARVLPHAATGLTHSFTMTFDPDVDIFALRHELEDVAARALDGAGELAGPGIGSSPPQSRLRFRTSDIGKYRVEVSIAGCTQPRQAENAVACAIGSFVHSRIGSADKEQSSAASGA
ncbi:mechanosensitive ion channel family protein [Croceicoccus marinus]|jgi:small-conductance mechanosensitive channel|uniref:Small-conductance mechanosensitive channel n=1 Tax=Croceicoccus marinus TaxID=450378 RepID=A0A7G6VW52_9SPHN|nr:mechanosensitive ion channel family protein [Croceicoccus marinus]QNE05967.1 mechanosensitive ion channel family protein [Croceicoccus marinus]